MDGFAEVRRELRSDVERWLVELRDDELRASIKVGNATRASNKVEWMLRRLVETFAERGDRRSRSIFAERSKGKPVDKLTMGECVKLLEEMNATQPPEGRFSKKELLTLNALPSGRKNIVHHDETDAAAIRSFLERCLWFCDLSQVREVAGE